MNHPETMLQLARERQRPVPRGGRATVWSARPASSRAPGAARAVLRPRPALGPVPPARRVSRSIATRVTSIDTRVVRCRRPGVPRRRRDGGMHIQARVGHQDVDASSDDDDERDARDQRDLSRRRAGGDPGHPRGPQVQPPGRRAATRSSSAASSRSWVAHARRRRQPDRRGRRRRRLEAPIRQTRATRSMSSKSSRGMLDDAAGCAPCVRRRGDAPAACWSTRSASARRTRTAGSRSRSTRSASRARRGQLAAAAVILVLDRVRARPARPGRRASPPRSGCSRPACRGCA